MNLKLEDFTIALCQSLPFSMDLFRKDGQCIKQSEKCTYYEKKGDQHICNKQAYIFKQGPSVALC